MSYRTYVLQNFRSYVSSRLLPFFGISIAAALLAHRSVEDLPGFSYVLALYAVIGAATSLPLAVIGNLAHHKKASLTNQQIFESGLWCAAIMCVGAITAGSFTLLGTEHAPSVELINANRMDKLSALYLPALGLLSVNTFLHFYHESVGRANQCAAIKKVTTTIGCASLAVAFFEAPAEIFIYFAIAYFPLVEICSLIALLHLSTRNKLRLIPKNGNRLARDFLILGGPIAAGMAGQKLYYYFLNQRLVALDATLVGELSILMSVMGLLGIPFVAFAQLHSIMASQGGIEHIFRKGLGVFVSLLIAVLGVLYIGGSLLFYLFGSDSLSFSFEAFWTLALSIGCSGYFALIMGHLRAHKDTLIPQLLINALMLGILVPLIYWLPFGEANIYTFIRLQSYAVLLAGGLLQWRLYQGACTHATHPV